MQPCAGRPSQTCGGAWTVGVYTTSGNKPSPPSDPTPIPPSDPVSEILLSPYLSSLNLDTFSAELEERWMLLGFRLPPPHRCCDQSSRYDD